MLKRKEFILGAAVGLTFAAAATAGGVISWPGAHAESVQAGRIIPTAGAAGLAFAPPQGAPLSFSQIFDQVAPAVVQINTETRIERPEGAAGGVFQIPGTPYAIPIPRGAQPRSGGEDGAEEDNYIDGRGAGSGFFISRDGYIVTNNHVVENAREITVVLSDQRELTARVVGRDEATDLAVLKVEGNDFAFVAFEEQNEPRVGDWVIAVGNPFGLGGTATAGIISAKGRDVPEARNSFVNYLQIDAAINTGNSGGPTFDIYGRVIGVNTAIYSPTGNSVGIGFAIPVAVAKPIVERLMRGETIERGYLGVEVGDFSRDYAEAQGLPADTRGAFINSVTPGGPSDRAGLQAGDVVVAINGQRIVSAAELTRKVGQAEAGETLRVEVLREGRRQTINVRSGTRPPESELNNPAAPSDEEGGPTKPSAPSGEVVAGLNLANLTPALRQRYNIPEDIEGVVVTGVARGGDRRFATSPGAVIFQVNGVRVNSVSAVKAQIDAARRSGRTSVFLLVRTATGNAPVVLELPAAAD